MIKLIRGMDVSIITTAKNDKDGLTILKQFGLPLKINTLIFKVVIF
jgi:ribosomal protein L5